MPSFSIAEVAGDVKRSAGGGSLLPLVEMGTVPPSVLGYDMLRPVIRFSHRHVYSDNCSCLIELHSRTMAVIRLSDSPTMHVAIDMWLPLLRDDKE